MKEQKQILEVFIMGELLEMQVVRLVEEIANDEKKIVELRREASDTIVDFRKTRYLEQADQVETSLNRKMNLLMILKK